MSRVVSMVAMAVCLFVNGSVAAAQARGQRPATAPTPAAEPAILGSPDREDPHPTITSLKGVGTPNAVAEARVTPQTMRDYCAERTHLFTSAAACLKQQQSQFGTKVFRASADCTAGRITTTGDQTYALDGLWGAGEDGAGRSRWVDASGAVVGADLINNGLHISQQWETLCPAPVTAAFVARVKAQRSAVPVVQTPPAASVDACAGKTRCYDAGSFVAEIVQVTPSIVKLSDDWHVVSMSVRFTNKTDRQLVLAYLSKSGALSDNFSNSYRPSNPEDVKGMGAIAGNKADPQFALRPGESRAATFIQGRQLPRAGNQPMGQTYTFVTSIAELDVVYGGQQIRRIRENSLTFANFVFEETPPPTLNAGGPPAPPPAPPGTGTIPPAPTLGDQCGGRSNCYDAGLFVAEIVQATPSITKATYDWHTITMNVRFRNKSDQPLVLAYVPATAALSDNFGNSYRSPANSAEVKGMGTIFRGKADPQFVLRPGESRAATFIQSRALPRAGNQPIGQTYTLTLPITELEVLYNGQQIKTVRENSMTFANFALGGGPPGVPNTEAIENIKKAGEALRGIFGGKK
jgi:hypothetical protein